MLWPGSPICRSSAEAKGELRPAPSIATEPGAVENAMKEPRVEFELREAGERDRRSVGRRAAEAAREGIVAAGIEKHQAGFRLLFHDVEDIVDLHRFEPELGGHVEPGIDRHDEVAPVDLQAVAGIVEQPDAGTVERIGEFADLALQRALAEVVALDDLEAEIAQPGGDIDRVVHRIGERAGFFIDAIADDQRHAPFRLRVRPQQQKPQKGQHQDRTPAHGSHYSASRSRPRQHIWTEPRI